MSIEAQLLNLITIGLKGDKVVFARQAAKLARTYDEAGDQSFAKEIRDSILEKGAYSLQKASSSLKETFSLNNVLPTDQETKFDLADISLPMLNAPKPLLQKNTINKINEFVAFTEKSKELKEAGLGVAPSMILFGPPGCGKTMAAKYIASILNLPLLTARCDSLVSSYLGSTSKNIRKLFEFASEKPCVLFLDELDALAKARDDQHELGELKRVVVSLLQNIDQLPDETVILAASNHEKLLDSAVWRRFAYRIPIDLPDFDVRKRLFDNFSEIESAYTDASQDLSIISEGLNCTFIEQCCVRSLRHSLIFNNGVFQIKFLIEALLEATLPLIGADEEAVMSNIVKRLRESDSKRFTIRKIAKILDISTAKVSRIAK